VPDRTQAWSQPTLPPTTPDRLDSCQECQPDRGPTGARQDPTMLDTVPTGPTAKAQKKNRGGCAYPYIKLWSPCAMRRLATLSSRHGLQNRIVIRQPSGARWAVAAGKRRPSCSRRDARKALGRVECMNASGLFGVRLLERCQPCQSASGAAPLSF
jgi:hypothetical protein